MSDMINAPNPPEWADPLQIMSSSIRFDLIFKLELAYAWAYGDARAIRTAEEAYLEMVRSRNGFRESFPPRSGPAAFIDAFRVTAASLLARGYDKDAPAIPLDANGELLNGAHRLASCAAYGKPCLVQRFPKMSSGGNHPRSFIAGKIAAPVAAWGMRAYLRRFPNGRLANEFASVSREEMPFPDWADRVKELKMFSLMWRIREKGYRFKALFRRGAALERALKHADECHHRAIAPFALARYWNERTASK